MAEREDIKIGPLNRHKTKSNLKSENMKTAILKFIKKKILVVLTILLCITNNSKAQNNSKMIAKMTMYDVKPDYIDEFRKILQEYVSHSISSKNNIMAEAYYNQDKTNILWLFERWESKKDLEDFNTSAQAESLKKLVQKALNKPTAIFFVKDLEPLTKQQWRTPAKKEDNPLTVVLFVDAKKGTEQNFKDIYHIAMPQFRSEPGVVTYQLSEIEGDKTQFVTYEKFRSNDAFQYHLNFPPIQPVIDYLQTSIKHPPFQNGLHNLVEFAPMTRL